MVESAFRVPWLLRSKASIPLGADDWNKEVLPFLEPPPANFFQGIISGSLYIGGWGSEPNRYMGNRFGSVACTHLHGVVRLEMG